MQSEPIQNGEKGENLEEIWKHNGNKREKTAEEQERTMNNGYICEPRWEKPGKRNWRKREQKHQRPVEALGKLVGTVCSIEVVDK